MNTPTPEQAYERYRRATGGLWLSDGNPVMPESVVALPLVLQRAWEAVTAQDPKSAPEERAELEAAIREHVSADCDDDPCSPCEQITGDVMALADAYALAGQQPQPAPDLEAAFASGLRVRTAPCTADAHDGEHFQVRTNGHWLCGHLLASLLIAHGILGLDGEQ